MARTTIAQANRPLAITTPLGENVLGLRRILVQERLGRPFAIEADLSSEDPDIKFDDLVGHPVAVRLNLPSGRPRFWHGVVARFQMVGMTERFYDYRASVVPWMWVMSRGADFRIFQNKNVPDLVQEVLRERGAKDFEARLSWQYGTWDYCVQYRETDLNFVSRLLEQEGITYYHQHDEGKGLLVLADGKSAYDTVPGYETIPFRPSSGSDPQREAVQSWIIEHELQPTHYAVNDYNPLLPGTDLNRFADTPRNHGTADRRMFDYPGEYETANEGVTVAQIRLEELQAGWQTLRAESNCMGLYAGCLFTLAEHPRTEQNREHLVTAMQLQFDAGSFDTDDITPRAHCSFSAIPSEIPYRPPRATPKPVVQGPQSAVVVGPAGEEIYTDEYGRVKVQFFWDRKGENDEKSSCWIRVAQSWAGKKWGAVFLPRIGHEVLVEFMEGDPDRPVITGSVYNGSNTPPYGLPAQKNVSTLKSDSTKGGGGFNELKLDDTKGKELLYVQAEKDRTVLVKNDNAETVGHDETISVGNDRKKDVAKNETTSIGDNRTESVGKNEKISIGDNRTEDVGKNETLSIGGSRTETVDKDETITIAGNRTESVGKNESVTVGGARDHSVGKNDTLNVGKELTVIAGDQITLKTGSASIVMKKDGTIQIKGKDITIEGSGGINVKASKNITMKGQKILQN